MEIFEPQNFFNMAGVIISVFTGFIALTGLIIAYKTYHVAHEAKDEWKRQKIHDYKVVVSANLLDLIDVLFKIYDFHANFTLLILSGVKNDDFKNRPLPELLSKDNRIVNVVRYYTNTTFSKEKYQGKLEELMKTIHPSVIGLNDADLSKYFNEIKEYIRYYNNLLYDIETNISFFKDSISHSGNVNQEYIELFFQKFDFDINHRNHEKWLHNIGDRAAQFI